MRITVCRQEHFNAAHRICKPDWSDERNVEVFGKCAYPHYHGHNYDLIVKVTGEPDPETSYVYDMKLLGELVKEHVSETFDHRNINLDVPEFQDNKLLPSTENIVVVIYNRLRPHIPAHLDLSLVLYETERNFVEYAG